MTFDERQITEEQVWDALRDVQDPEIPVLSIVDLRIVRAVEVSDDTVKVVITPTFSGCPALDHMKEQIHEKLSGLGVQHIDVVVNRSLSWSTDLLDDSVKSKLRSFGVAPPPMKQENSLSVALSLPVECPFCSSSHTNLESPFGSTLCKQIFYCDNCRQSFERFKPL